MGKRKNGKADSAREIQIPIEWGDAGEAPTYFANHLHATIDEHDCHMAFYDIGPPALAGSQEEKLEQAKNIKSVRARCVARVVISRTRLRAFSAVLATLQAQVDERAAGQQGESEPNGDD